MIAKLKRREFITLLGGAAAAWPLAARAQRPDRMRRIGVIMNITADDPECSGSRFRVRKGAAGIGLDRRSQRADRLSVGRRVMPNAIADRRPNCSHSTPDVIVSWRAETLAGRNKRAAPCRSCSRNPSTRLAPAWSRAWRGPAATPPVSRSLNTV